ncbi:HrpF/NolX family T3SS translocon protein, partial [Ralstonia pseudosolanacearum]
MSTNISSAASPTLPLAGPGVNGPAEGKSDMPGSLFFQFDHPTGPSLPDLPADLFFSFGDSVSRAVQNASNQSPEQNPATDPATNPTPTGSGGQCCQPAPAGNTPAPSQPATPPAGSDVTWNGGTLNDTQLQIIGILNLHKDNGDISWDKLQDKINDPNTPPDLKWALQALSQDFNLFQAIGSQGDGRFGGKIKGKDLAEFAKSHSQVLTWNSGTLNDSQLEIMSILARHKDKMPVDWSSIQDKINDSNTPSDLKAALQALANDPALFFAIGSQGDGNCKGKIKAGDVSKFADNHPQVEEYN